MSAPRPRLTAEDHTTIATAVVDELERRAGVLLDAIDQARLALADADEALCLALSELGITIRSASVSPFPRTGRAS